MKVINEMHCMSARRIAIRHRRKKEPVLWIIDSEQWPRACLRAELIERGYDPRGFLSITDAVDALLKGASPKPDAIILELRGQAVNAANIHALQDLHVPIILLGGDPELNDPLIQSGDWTTIMKRPISLGAIADAVQSLSRHGQ
jgi:hypothetical protein